MGCDFWGCPISAHWTHQPGAMALSTRWVASGERENDDAVCVYSCLRNRTERWAISYMLILLSLYFFSKFHLIFVIWLVNSNVCGVCCVGYHAYFFMCFFLSQYFILIYVCIMPTCSGIKNVCSQIYWLCGTLTHTQNDGNRGRVSLVYFNFSCMCILSGLLQSAQR